MKTTKATVMWFNKAKGYGEVELANGERAFISGSAIPHSELGIGSKLSVKYEAIHRQAGFLSPGDLVVVEAKQIS